jgi:molecular chaperone GrpE
MRRRIDINADRSGDPETTPDTSPETEGADPTGNSEPADTGATDYITALQAEIEDLRARMDEAEKKTLYTQAEFANYRRRREEEMASLQKFMNREVILGLLPIIDNFERALRSAETSRNVDALLAGLTGTLKQLQTFLEKAGVRPIEAVGKEFDPNFHEAIGHAEEGDLPPNVVAQEVQRGYVMHDRVLRPSLVKVSQG